MTRLTKWPLVKRFRCLWSTCWNFMNRYHQAQIRGRGLGTWFNWLPSFELPKVDHFRPCLIFFHFCWPHFAQHIFNIYLFFIIPVKMNFQSLFTWHIISYLSTNWRLWPLHLVLAWLHIYLGTRCTLTTWIVLVTALITCCWLVRVS